MGEYRTVLINDRLLHDRGTFPERRALFGDRAWVGSLGSPVGRDRGERHSSPLVIAGRGTNQE
jgi:hypothetical protein